MRRALGAPVGRSQGTRLILEASPRSKELCLANFLKRRPMSTPTIAPRLVEPFRSAKRQLYIAGIAVVLAITPFAVWPRLSGRLLSTDFLPHAYCYLRNPGLVWTHVVADSLIGISYLAISVTMAYLVYHGRHDLPFRGCLRRMDSLSSLVAPPTWWRCLRSGCRSTSCQRP